MDDLISVIIPVYKVEGYLSKCIESVINQTYSNIEIILVDDGSPDNCGKICDEYAKIDNRIIVIHKENGGVSSARNAGMDIASGKFISFVDGDDYISYDYISKLYDLLKDNDLPMSMCSINIDKNGSIAAGPSFNSDGEFQSDCLINEILNFKTISAVFCKLFRNETINNLRFKNYSIAEDLLFLIEYLQTVERIISCNDKLYYYVLNSEGAIRNPYNYKKYESLEVYDEILKLSENKDYYSKAKARLVRGNFHILLKIPKQTYRKEYDLICSKIREYRKEVMLDRSNNTKTRLACALSYLGFGLVKAVFKLVNKGG